MKMGVCRVLGGGCGLQAMATVPSNITQIVLWMYLTENLTIFSHTTVICVPVSLRKWTSVGFYAVAVAMTTALSKSQ